MEEEALDYNDWERQMCSKYPMFSFWNTVITMELNMLSFVRSLREANFEQYVITCKRFMPYMFALDHVHYARWLSVHLKDMELLPHTHPDIYEEFKKGAFVATKSKRGFSNIALDQAHEQENCRIKGDGGAVGLTECPEALRRWMIAGPEISRIVKEFEESACLKETEIINNHHEVTISNEKKFIKDVRSLVNEFEELCNPFYCDSMDLYTLDTKQVIKEGHKTDILNMYKLGSEQYDSFVNDR